MRLDPGPIAVAVEREFTPTLPKTRSGKIVRKLNLIDAAVALTDLSVPPGNRLELLRGNRNGQRSIRINDQYRICFRWTEAGPDEVQITDYHD